MKDSLIVVQEVLQDCPMIQIGIVFGSAGTLRQRPSSDVDVAVAAERILDARERMALIDSLTIQLERPVDLVDLMNVSGPILQQALSKGRIVLNRNPILYAKLILKMWYNQADMMPGYRMILNRRLEVFTHG